MNKFLALFALLIAVFAFAQDPDNAFKDVAKQAYLGNAYVMAIGTTTVATTTETPLLLLNNTSTKGKSIFLDLIKGVSLTSGNTAIFNLYKNPSTSSTGTAQTISNLRIGNTTASDMAGFKSPTVSSNGTFLGSVVSGSFSPGSSQIIHVIDPGQSVLINAVVSGNTTSVQSELNWYEY